MKNITFNRISFFRAFPILGVLCFIIFGTVNLLAQTAMVTNNFVYYPPTQDQVANYQCVLSPSSYPNSNSYGNRSFFLNPNHWFVNGYNEASEDPWVNSALIEFDQVYPDETTPAPYPNHCLTLCAEVTCSNPVRLIESSNSSGTATVINTIASGDFPIQTILFDIFKYQAGSNPYNADTTPPIRTIAMYPAQNGDLDNVCKGVPVFCSGEDCNIYPEQKKSCCDDCTWPSGTGRCSAKSNSCQSASTCNAQFCDFHIGACVNHSTDSCAEEGTTQSLCTGMYGNICEWTNGRCRYKSPNICSTNLIANGECDSDVCSRRPGCRNLQVDRCADEGALEVNCTGIYGNICEWVEGVGCRYKNSNICATNFLATGQCDSDVCAPDPVACYPLDPSPCVGLSENNCTTGTANTYCQWTPPSVTFSCHHPNECNSVQSFPSESACKAGLKTLHFCTPWDGTYEIDGEFGKSNGQFGFRTTIKTNYPGDGISVTSDLNIEHMIAYPGDTQIPMQVDVTNVHSVRSSPTLVGTSPAVTSAPYRLRYRLSKDATTTINIIDAELSNLTPISGNPADYFIHRHLVEGQPRDGEGFQGGAQNDLVITNEDSWDGRDDYGRLLPYGNYMVSIQASSRDEWTGPVNRDLSRAVTRQLSLDPLKITDIAVTGLGKESTSYAKIDYMLTEAATVHLEIYTPGTTFDGTFNITPMAPGVTPAPTVLYPSNTDATVINLDDHAKSSTTGLRTGYRVASYVEQKARRTDVNMKWDGMCWDTRNCQTEDGSSSPLNPYGTTGSGYAYGGAVPDGDYVYLLWAEIPYGSSVGGTGSTDAGEFPAGDNIVVVNNVAWDGVKTRMIHNGIIPVNRGFPEITIDAVSYSTIGSSPIANGLDPFVISYSLSRDSYVDAGIYTIAANGTDTAGYCEEWQVGEVECAPFKVKTISANEVKEALTRNVYYWDGLDDNGRYVSPGNYMLRITAKDSLFPAKMVTRTIEFPVDMFRVVDVTTTPLLELGSSATLSGLASISYMLSKSMDVSVKIYSTGTVIPTSLDCHWPLYEMTTDPAAPGYYYCQGNVNCCIHQYPNVAADVYPIKEFKGTRQGEGYTITDYWDGYKVDATQIATEMMPDGLYPYVITAGAQVPWAEYYRNVNGTGTVIPQYGPAHPKSTPMYASDRVTGYVTISRGPVYFTDINIRATHPTQYYSSATVELAPYEIEFSVNRISSVTVEIISTVAGACSDENGNIGVGTVCRTLTRTNFINGNLLDYNVYDADVLNTLYWDGKDAKGNYVKIANYQVKFTAVPYLGNNNSDPGLNITVENRNLVVNNFQVFDRYIWDVATQNKGQGKFAYQISVPMKTAIQIFKPGTRVVKLSTGELENPILGYTSQYGNVYSTDTRDVLVKAIVGVRPNLVSLEEIWDGTDYAGQKVPDGIYPFRYVTVLDSYRMNSITGDPIVDVNCDKPDDPNCLNEVSEVVMDWDKYINLSVINVVNGDSWYADIDWKDPKVTMFYPNPLKEDNGFFEVTKVPAPGTLTIKIYNIAGDLVRDSGYDCVNAIGTVAKLEDFNSTYGGITPDWNYNGYSNPVLDTSTPDPDLLGSHALGRNSALRCKWDKKNNASKKVARGLYYAIMTLDPTRGNAKKSQRVIKILIP
ncbi:MAG: hypothetical protein J5594_05315 [Elusimicrobiaceae bacterium]|nr:hypothetical protein [Elusimicrobiaceae bacterium]